jgi:HlyD family secretion protein
MINNRDGEGRALIGLALLGCGLARADPEPEFQGTVEFEQVDVGFEYSGRLAALSVHRGEHVEAGQRLATMDGTLERAATRARQSETDAARARAAVTQAGTRPEEIRALEARIRAADAEIRRMRDNLARDRKLAAEGVTPPAAIDDLAAELERGVAERDALQQNLVLLQRGPRHEEVAALERQADATQALLEAQREREGRFDLTAPLAGEVLDTLFEPGEVALAGVPVVSIADTTRPFADVFVPEGEMARVRQGAPIRLRVDALTAPLGGRVERIAQSTEFTPRYLFSERERQSLVVRVRVRIDDPGRTLRAGLPARVVFEGEMNAASEEARDGR